MPGSQESMIQTQIQPKLRSLGTERGGTRLQLVVTPEKKVKVNFVGTSYVGEAQAGELYSYGLGILDKATNTLKIIPISNNKKINLAPLLMWFTA